MGNSIIEEDLEDYLQKIDSRDDKEIEELIKKVSESYHDIIKQLSSAEKEYTLIIVLYAFVHFFNIRQIEFFGVSLKEIPFTPLFLILASYLFYRLISVYIQKCHLHEMYAIISEKSKNIFYEKMYHYFFIPSRLGLIEEIYKTKFKMNNAHIEIIQDFKFIVYFIFVFALFVINILEAKNIDNSDTKSFAIVAVGMFVAVAINTVTFVNLYHFTKLFKERKKNQ